VQSKFRDVIDYFNATVDVTEPLAVEYENFVHGKEGKRRKLEKRVLICAADDALKKAGVAAGLRAGQDDERRVLLFQDSAKVTARINQRHKFPDWPGEARGERAAKVSKASDDIATLCSGPLGKRLSLKRSACHPAERFMELVNNCMLPLGARWELKDNHGYRAVKLHDMLLSPWVGPHTVDVPLQWRTFWYHVQLEKKEKVSKKDRRRRVQEALEDICIPSADGRKLLLEAREGDAGSG
jgi:hypothetical protein